MLKIRWNLMEILQKLKKKISQEAFLRILNIFLQVLNNIGLNELFMLKNKKKLIILTYHGISCYERFLSPYHIPKSAFLKHLSYLRRKKYKFIQLTDWIKIISNKKVIKHKYIILTCDDGYKTTIKIVYRILKRLGLCGQVFIISDYIGSDNLLWGDFIIVFLRNFASSKFKFIFKNQLIEYPLDSEKCIQKAILDILKKFELLNNIEKVSHLDQFNIQEKNIDVQKIASDFLIANWEEIKSLDERVLKVGCHTRTHAQLNEFSSEEEFFQELIESKIKIEEKIHYPITDLCYPFGSYNKKIIHYAKNYGYLTGVTVTEGFNSINDDLFQLKRIVGYENFALFKANVSGLSLFLKKLLSLICKYD